MGRDFVGGTTHSNFFNYCTVLIPLFLVCSNNADRCDKIADCKFIDKESLVTCFKNKCYSTKQKWNCTKNEDCMSGKCTQQNDRKFCQIPKINCLNHSNCGYGALCGLGIDAGSQSCFWAIGILDFPPCKSAKDCVKGMDRCSPSVGCIPNPIFRTGSANACLSHSDCDIKEECRYGYCVAKYGKMWKPKNDPPCCPDDKLFGDGGLPSNRHLENRSDTTPNLYNTIENTAGKVQSLEAKTPPNFGIGIQNPDEKTPNIDNETSNSGYKTANSDYETQNFDQHPAISHEKLSKLDEKFANYGSKSSELHLDNILPKRDEKHVNVRNPEYSTREYKPIKVVHKDNQEVETKLDNLIGNIQNMTTDVHNLTIKLQSLWNNLRNITTQIRHMNAHN